MVRFSSVLALWAIHSLVPRLHAERVYGCELKQGGEAHFWLGEGKPGFKARQYTGN